MKRVLSGIQPSGSLHIGNYFGMMSRMIKYQDENDLFSCIVNYHALTTINDPDLLRNNTINATLDFFALGLDPEKSTFWIQGDVPIVTEFTWIISNITNVGMIERSTSYKDKISKGVMPNMGLFNYPILMASDILCFGSDIVPVGKDQKQHLEMARDIAIKFNNTYGDILVIPQEDIDKNTQLVPGIDGQKMSKSYDNIIPIFGDEKFIKKQIMSIVTDSTPVDQPKDLNSPLYKLFTLFLTEKEKKVLENKFLSPGLQYGKVKQDFFDVVMEYFRPFRDKRAYLSNNMDYVLDHLNSGSKKATLVADQTPWDLYMAGDENALSQDAKFGWRVFQELRCVNCHEPPLFTNNDYLNIGLRLAKYDLGRQAITGIEEDAGEVKVPSLRNVGLRSRFMHTGEFSRLSEAIVFYDNGIALPGRDDIPNGGAYNFNITGYVPYDLEAFLRNGLTDPRVENETFPFDRPTLSSELQGNK